MCYIPDPIELMEAREEQLAYEWDRAQKNVPEGSFCCPYCSRVFEYEPIQVDARPDSAFCCYDCLPADVKKAYDAFEQKMSEDRSKKTK